MGNPPPGGTPLDIAAVIDRVLQRNINFPFRALADGASVATVLDKFFEVDATAGNATVTLPNAATAKKGMAFGIKKIDASSNTVTIQVSGGGTIDGAASKVLVNQNDFVVAVSNGTNYKIYAVTISPSTTGGAVFYQIEKIVKTNGITTLVPVAGTLINFTVAVDGECAFWAGGDWSGNQIFAGGSLAFRVDGVDYASEGFGIINGAGSDTITEMSLSPHISLFLTAGPHTVELVASQSGIALNASAGHPLTLSVLFPGASANVASPTPKAATFVVHPTPGIGDYTTIQNALDALVALGGGYVLVREGTYAENLVMPDVPVVLRGVGDNTKISLGVVAGTAFSVSHNQEYVFEDMQVVGDATAAQIVLAVPATVTGTKKILLNRVNSYDSVKTIVSNSGVTTPLIEIRSSALRGATAGWASAGGGTLILNNLAGSIGSVTGSTSATIVKINGAQVASVSGSSTNALVTVVPTITNENGLFGIGTVKNTDGANSIDVNETFTDAFGTSSTLTTTVAFGDSLMIGLQQNIGTGFPPYTSYKVEIIDTVAGNHATYNVKFVSQGAI